MSFSVTILGSASAKPTPDRHPSAQIVKVHEQHYLVDAGEGAQQQMFRYGINPLKLRAVFISHLHGDHVFGLFPLISTLGLYGRRTPLKIFGPAPLGEMLGCHLRYFDTQLPYEIEWVEVDTTRHALLFENRTLEVWSVPLRHRIPTSGYLFREKQPPLNVRKEKITEYGLSIARITAAKRGEDILLDNGDTLPNAELTYRPYAPRSYAYLSDTSWSPKAAKLVEGADLLYHETTYAHAEHKIARERGHSTTVEAARIALKAGAGRLVIGHYSSRYKEERSGRRGPHGISRYPPGHRRHNIHDRKTAATMTKAEIQLVRSLADKRSRTEHGLFVAEGHKFIGELCTSALRVRKIFALEGLFEGGEVETVSSREMERLSLLKTPSDSLALVEIPHHPFRPDTAQRELVLALDQVQNPGNLGTIIRLADWFGIPEIVCSPTTADCYNPKVVQATMGAILRVKVHYTALEPYLAQARERNIPVYGTFLEGENIYSTPLTPGGIVLMGNEGQGIAPAAARHVSHKLFIPPYPADRNGSESLNVAIATAVVCAEFRRQASAKR